MADPVIKAENISKEYRLGAISGQDIYRDFQSWWARVRGREDPNSLVTADNTHKYDQERRKHFLALNDISFEVKKGDAFGIVGKNGAGKSTLLKVLTRITSPTTGTIKIKGRMASLLEVGTGFHQEMTGRENVYMNGAILGMRRWEIARKMDEIIAFSELEKFIDTPVKRYSSGMYVRLAFSVAAHLDAEILIMDEVLAVGDTVFQQKCLNKMNDVAKQQGRTVLFVSHNMNALKELCNKGILL
ncbi:MAG: ABC transporter ATP-binding protein, partial [Candidatus Margulisbacteria bacterium]|nr:ABC transporter ATP-binding protein [Candidatus Margulisiibacteriota bacterium]